MKKLLLSLCCLFLLTAASPAFAINIKAMITADNHYALYWGDADGDPLNYVGGNEIISGGSEGAYNWSVAEEHNFVVTSGSYLYVAAWSDDNVAQGWIGEFNSSNSNYSVLSNTTDWEYMATNHDLDTGAAHPTAEEAGAYISDATWLTVPEFSAYDWGDIEGISSEADWIWGSAMYPGSAADGNGEYLIFRTQVNPVPEPATMLLFGLGLLGFAGVSRRKQA